MVAEKLRIMVADAHTLYREGIASLLGGNKDIEVTSLASSENEVIEAAAEQSPDVILLDAFLPPTNGIEITRHLRVEHITSRVILLTQAESRLDLGAGFRAGVSGFFSKKGSYADLASAIARVSQGDYIVHLYMDGPGTGDHSDSLEQPDGSDNFNTLTTRERQVLKLVAEGSRTSEIAARLSMSAPTVSRHRARTMKKLGVHSAAELVRYAIVRGGTSLGNWETAVEQRTDEDRTPGARTLLVPARDGQS